MPWVNHGQKNLRESLPAISDMVNNFQAVVQEVGCSSRLHRQQNKKVRLHARPNLVQQVQEMLCSLLPSGHRSNANCCRLSIQSASDHTLDFNAQVSDSIMHASAPSTGTMTATTILGSRHQSNKPGWRIGFKYWHNDGDNHTWKPPPEQQARRASSLVAQKPAVMHSLRHLALFQL